MEKTDCVNDKQEAREPHGEVRHKFTFETSADWEPGTYGCFDECPFASVIDFDTVCSASTCPFRATGIFK